QCKYTGCVLILVWFWNFSRSRFKCKIKRCTYNCPKTFTTTGPTGLDFFGAFADVTTFVKATGNVNYTLSDLDLTNVIPTYCPTGSNYAGWSIVVVYEDLALPNRVVSVYEGFQIVDHTGQNVTIALNGLNVTNVNNAKVGFLAWEGDDNLA